MRDFFLRDAARCRLIRTFMKVRLYWLLLPLLALALPACTSRETKDALQKVQVLNDLKHYTESEQILTAAIANRTALIRSGYPAPSPDDVPALKKIQHAVKSDREVLQMERALATLYAQMHRPDDASNIYLDILDGSPHDAVIRDLLHDPDPVVRSDAARVLGITARPQAVAALTGALQDPDKNVRRSAVAALAKIKTPDAIQALLTALHDSYWFVRSDAASALGPLEATQAVGPLFDALRDPDSNVQSAATSSLLFLARVPGAPVEEYAKHLNDPLPQVSSLAAICCVLLKDARAFPVLAKFLQTGDAPTRLNIVRALGQSGDPDAIPLLRERLKDPVESVRGWSIVGLGRLNDKGSVPVLRTMSQDDSQSPAIRQAASDVLQALQ